MATKALDPSDRYTKVAVTLHWLIALLIIGQLAGGIYMHNLPATTWKFELYQWHKSFGIMVLLLSLARLGWRLTHRAPALPDGMKGWEKVAARITHVAFYALIIAVPLAGWLMVSASPYDLPTVLFKLIPWPHVPGIPQDAALEGLFKEVHEIMAFAIIGLLVLHVGAALKHHFINRDAVLTRMIPILSKKG